eukprot:13386029-Alexandrium_andersonii.AAC.1
MAPALLQRYGAFQSNPPAGWPLHAEAEQRSPLAHHRPPLPASGSGGVGVRAVCMESLAEAAPHPYRDPARRNVQACV